MVLCSVGGSPDLFSALCRRVVHQGVGLESVQQQLSEVYVCIYGQKGVCVCVCVCVSVSDSLGLLPSQRM